MSPLPHFLLSTLQAGYPPFSNNSSIFLIAFFSPQAVSRRIKKKFRRLCLQRQSTDKKSIRGETAVQPPVYETPTPTPPPAPFINFALASITKHRFSPDRFLQAGMDSHRSEKNLSIEYLSFSTELGILGEWCARPRCPARIGRFTCHLRRNERERTAAAGEKRKDEQASE